jgi:hypothetical protein
MNTYKSPKITLEENEVFVFGANSENGFHGCGSAGFASFGEFGNVWRKYDYASKPNGEIVNHGGFLDRNLLVAKDADIFLAMTFGNKNEAKDGGTKHTVNSMLKQGKRGWHLDLNDLKLFRDAK